MKRLAVVLALGLLVAELVRLEGRVAALEGRVGDEGDRIEGALSAAALASEDALAARAARKRAEGVAWGHPSRPIRLEPSNLEGVAVYTTYCDGASPR